MILDLSALLNETIERMSTPVEFELPADADVTPVSTVVGDVRAQRFGAQVLVLGHLSVTIEQPCSRCLAPAWTEVQGEVEASCPVRGGGFVELPSTPEHGISAFTETGIDLSIVARELAILNAPLRLVCRDDCRGLCAGCGVNLNESRCQCGDRDIDPRLAPLLALRLREQESLEP